MSEIKPLGRNFKYTSLPPSIFKPDPKSQSEIKNPAILKIILKWGRHKPLLLIYSEFVTIDQSAAESRKQLMNSKRATSKKG